MSSLIKSKSFPAVDNRPIDCRIRLSCGVPVPIFNMRLPLLSTILLLAATATSMPAASTDISQREADPSLAGYLGVFFLGNEPSVYFYLSNGNNAFSFKALNGGRSILDPKLGTGGVRDPSLIEGGGAEKGKKWYIIGTDLDIAKVCSA